MDNVNKIIGGVTTTPMRFPDWNQIRNKPNVVTQEQYDAEVGDIASALDSILAMQEALIGGGV